MSIKAKPQGYMVHNFASYPSNAISRSKFNRSNGLLTSMNGGYLVPIYKDVAVPGDTLTMDVTAFARLATQKVPFMDNAYMDVHFFKVPIRLLWEHWVNMNGEQANPDDSTDYLTPQCTTDDTTSEITVGSIFDYFDLPLGAKSLSFNSFYFRAYNLIWNEWYRDESLQDRVSENKGDTDDIDDYTLLKRGKRKDYFTSCLPWPQKGPAVDLPLGQSAPVVGNGVPTSWVFAPPVSIDASSETSLFQTDNYNCGASCIGGAANWLRLTSDPDNSGMICDLSDATASTINSLRQAFALQRMYEKDAIGGTRYVEMILSHFGIQSPDGRLQRPEFIGGATFNLNLNTVAQTSSTNSTTPQGNLSSYGVIQGRSSKIVTSFTEHCVVIGLASIRSDYTYQQGLDREYFKRSRMDYYLPVLANLGEQAVLNKEIYAQGADVKDSDGNVIDEQVFGYQERWAEMRYKPSRISGQLRSTAPQSLDIWHLAQDFESLPKLNDTFIEENPPFDRVIAIEESENTPQFICNFWFNEVWARPLPVYSVPNLSSHF